MNGLYDRIRENLNMNDGKKETIAGWVTQKEDRAKEKHGKEIGKR